MRLKVEGIRECAEVLVVALTHDRDHHIFGRRTLPEMDLASVACAIQNLWLVARAEGVGMGWVSLFDPERLAQLLGLQREAGPSPSCAWAMCPNFISGRCWNRPRGHSEWTFAASFRLFRAAESREI